MPNLDLSKAEFFADKIMVLKDVLSEEEAAWVIDIHKNLDSELDELNNQVIKKLIPWETSSKDHPHTYGTKREAENTENRLQNTTSQRVKDYYLWVKNLFDVVGRHYHETLGIDYEDGQNWTDFATFHYKNGEEMGPHVDYDGEPELAPIATGLLYLNSDKVGGDLYFKDQDVLIESKRGTLVIFPCVRPYYHQSTKITSGEKYHIGTAWKKNV